MTEDNNMVVLHSGWTLWFIANMGLQRVVFEYDEGPGGVVDADRFRAWLEELRLLDPEKYTPSFAEPSSARGVPMRMRERRR